MPNAQAKSDHSESKFPQIDVKQSKIPVAHEEKEDPNKKIRNMTPSKRESIVNLKAVTEKRDRGMSVNNNDLKTVEKVFNDKLNPNMMYLNISCDKASNVSGAKQNSLILKNVFSARRQSIKHSNIDKKTYESMRRSKLANIFKDIQESLQEGREVQLKGIGLKETPYNKLLIQAEKDKLIVKRKDFIESLEIEK